MVKCRFDPFSVGYRVKSQRGVQFRQWATGKICQKCRPDPRLGESL